MPATHAWEHLRDQYLSALQQIKVGTWLGIWRLLVTHPWYQTQLNRCARRILYGDGRFDWHQDLQQDAMLLLARNLRRAPGLGMDADRAQDHFPGWMRAVITQDCQEALRRLKRHAHGEITLSDAHQCRDENVSLEARIELSMAIDELEEPLRTIVGLYASGYNAKQIAERLDLKYPPTLRALHRGLDRLRIEFQPASIG